MAEFVSLTCPACGAKLKVTDEKDRYICEYCETEQLIDRKTQTISYIPAENISPPNIEIPQESASELALKRLRQEISDLENALEGIGMVDSPLGIAICSINVLLPQLLFAGAAFFGVWAVGSLSFLDGIDLTMTRVILGMVGVGITIGAFKAIPTGAKVISHSRRNAENRKRILQQLRDALNELGTYRNAAFAAQVERTSLELATENAISQLKRNVADLQNRQMEIAKPESAPSIIVSTMLGFFLFSISSCLLLSWASSQALPFEELPFIGGTDLPNYLWTILGILGLAFTLLTLKAIEAGIEKWDRRQFHLEENKRISECLSFEQTELEKHQNTISHFLK